MFHKLPLVFFALVPLCFSLSVYDGVLVREAERTIDASSAVARHTTVLNVVNQGTDSTTEFYLTVEEDMAKKLALLTVQEESGAQLETSASENAEKNGISFTYFKVNLGKSLGPQDSVTLTVSMAFSNAFTPMPQEIDQHEPQFMNYVDNHFFFSPYVVEEQTTTVVVGTTGVESHSEEEPTAVQGEAVVYGPYENKAAFSYSPLQVHFFNNAPFLSVDRAEKTIEISHWGNANVEEWYYSLRHVGAKIRAFSRFDFMRSRTAGSSVQSLTHVLPMEATNIYYRDAIGNISTSTVQVGETGLNLVLSPRFPLFGGWKTSFYMGYDLPLQEYLFTDAKNSQNYILNISFGATWAEDVVVDDMTVKVILPEGAKNIETHLPFSVDGEEKSKTFTYLDTYGRPVVVIKKGNLIAEHDQHFQVTYTFSKMSMLQEPLLLVFGWFFFFLFCILYSRVNISILDNEEKLENSRMEGLVHMVRDIHDQRSTYHKSLRDATSKLGKGKKSSTYATEKKNTENLLRKCEADMLSICNELEELDKDLAKQVRQVAKMERERKKAVDKLIDLEMASSEKKIQKAAYEAEKKKFEALYNSHDETIDAKIGDLIDFL